MNQHGHVKIIHQPCANKDCRNMVRLTPYSRSRRRRFCSRECIVYPLRLTPRRIQLVVENAGRMMYKDMARRLGMTRNSFQCLLTRLRKEGYKLPPKCRKISIFKSKSHHMEHLTKNGQVDKRGNRNNGHPGITDHMRRKPSVEGVKCNKEDKPIKSRKVVDGPIVFFIGKTRFSARDEEHEKKLREKYSYLEKNLVAGLKLR